MTMKIGDLIPIGGNNLFGDGSDGVLNSSSNITFSVSRPNEIVMKQYESIKINKGHTLTTSSSCGALLLFSKGDVIIDGTISMTERGGIGGDLSFLRHILGDNELLIGGFGGDGGIGRGYDGVSLVGGKGGKGRLCGGGYGGGGAGGCLEADGHNKIQGQSGFSIENDEYGLGLSPYGYGAGGGGAGDDYRIFVRGGANNGGGGGGGGARMRAGNWKPPSEGCNGNPAGGLIVIVAKGNIVLNGTIEANGGAGGAGGAGACDYVVINTRSGSGGGGAGGGIVALYYKQNFYNNGTIQVNGGAGGAGGAEDVKDRRAKVDAGFPGTSGGIGSIRIKKL